MRSLLLVSDLLARWGLILLLSLPTLFPPQLSLLTPFPSSSFPSQSALCHTGDPAGKVWGPGQPVTHPSWPTCSPAQDIVRPHLVTQSEHSGLGLVFSPQSTGWAGMGAATPQGTRPWNLEAPYSWGLKVSFMVRIIFQSENQYRGLSLVSSRKTILCPL